MASNPSADASIVDNRPWYRTLTGYQWFVFIVCCLAWDMDCMDQQLFNLARRPAMSELVPAVAENDPRLPAVQESLAAQRAKENKPAPTPAEVRTAQFNADVDSAGGWATS